MLATSESVRRLLEIEDRGPDILHAVVEGATLPLWPQVRMFFAQSLTSAELGENAVTSTADPWTVRKRLIKSLLPSRWDARGLRSQRDLLVLAGGATVRTVGAHEENWLMGDYLRAAPHRAALLQWRPLPSPGGTPMFSPTRTLDPMEARIDLRASRRGLSDTQAASLERLLDGYAQLLDGVLTPAQLESVKVTARRFELLRPFFEDEFERILDRTRPSTVMVEDASYGHRGALIAQMKARGIHVVEPQHGWIGPSHAAYNFGAAMSRPEMRAQLPDELLTFGDFWSEGIRVPYTTTALGKPHLEREYASSPPIEQRDRIVLVVSSIADPESSQRFVLGLRDALRGWVVRFRPHPSERSSLSTRYPGLIDEPGVEIDPETDVYASLSTARAVVGTASTVLYEALPFGVAVYVRESPHSAYYAGSLFGDTLEDDNGPGRIAAELMAGSVQRHENRHQFWASDAESNVRAWVTSRLQRT